jgi:cytochrome P450
MANNNVAEIAPTAARTIRQMRELPGPPGLPILGNMLQLHSGRVHLDIEAWAEQFGPFFRFRLGRRRFLAVSDHEAIIAVLRDRPDGFRRSVRGEEVTREMGMAPGVFISNGEAWRSQRSMVMSAFDPAHVKAYFPTLLTVTKRLHRRWQAAAWAAASIDLRADLMRYTVDGVAGLAFGHDINTLESDQDVIQNHLDKIFPVFSRRLLAPIPYWRYFRLASDRQLDRSIAAVNAAVQAFIATARERMKANPTLQVRPTNLLEAMIAAAAREGSGVGDRDIAGNVLTMLLAGEDTTANTLAWMIWLLHKNPDALARCRDEVRSIVPELSSMTPETMASLDYLEACASETMRLKPVVPAMLAEALRDTTIGDVRVPAGTIVWCIFRHDTMKDCFFPHAKAFEPQRWLAGGAHGADSAKRIAMPFGGGPRVCPGRYLALLEIKMAMAVLLGQFDVESLTTADGGQPDEHMAITMGPVGLRMRLREFRPR